VIRAGRGEDGMATAEMAVVLPTLMALVLLACGLVATCQSALRCEDAARLAARSLARGDDPDSAAALARADAPAQATVAVIRAGGDVRVRVTDSVGLPGPLGSLLPRFPVHGTAVALDESVPAATAPGGSGS
jgi:Flp pilus assembly protein TadG